jgi:type IV pilus assembly protein PilW
MYGKSRVGGFSLVEMMVAVVIGLVVILIIGQVSSDFEGQKRTSTGGGDAQTNGMVALFALEREIRAAGFGLTGSVGLACTGLNISYGGTVVSNGVPLAPVRIIDGGAANSDAIVVARGDTVLSTAPIPAAAINLGASPPTIMVGADNGFALKKRELEPNTAAGRPTVLMLAAKNSQKVCTLLQLSGVSADNKTLTFASGAAYPYNPSGFASPPFTNFPTYSLADDMLIDLNRFEHRRYEIQCDQLVASNPDAVAAPNCSNTDPVASNIAFVKAQYGVAPAGSQTVNQWVDATGAWANPTGANIERIKAVRLAVVARNSQYSRDPVTTAPLTLWSDVNGNPEKTMNMSGEAQQYRYRVFQTVVPIRNMIWATKP